MGGYMNRGRAHSETSDVYNPDLEYAQAGYADAQYGRGAPTGSWGMTGGAYPTAGKDRPGYGSNAYDNPFDFHSRPGGDSGSAQANQNYQNFGGGPAGTLPPGGGTGIYPGGRGAGMSGSTGTGAGYGYGANQGSGYQFGPQQGGTGNYSAMGPYQGGGYGGGYQFGSQGAQGDLNATGAAAYGGYQGVANQYARLGRQGVTSGERQNLMAASNEPIQAQLAANRDIIGNRVAQSGNSAGALSAQARLGASAGNQLETASRQNQIAIMQENQRRKEAGLAGQMGAAQGQAGLYGTSSGYMANLLAGRGRLASLTNRRREDGTTTGGGGSISASSFSGGG